MRVLVVGGVVEEGLLSDSLQVWSRGFGAALAKGGHSLLVFSPFPDVVDALVAEAMGSEADIQVHHPRSSEITALWDQKVPHARHFHYPEIEEGRRREAWIFCLIAGMESADVVVLVGGRRGSVATLAVQVADLRGKSVLPVPGFGGAGELAFRNLYYRLKDHLGPSGVQEVEEGNPSELVGLLPRLVSAGSGGSAGAKPRLSFFVSYSRSQSELADVVEVTLRRRGHVVFRDESEFSPSAPLPQEIKDWLHQADIVIVLWSQSYACSPWCDDEVELALDRMERGAAGLWLIRLDDTRVVPRRARQLPYFDARNREQVLERVEMLLVNSAHQNLIRSATASITASSS